MTVLCSTPLTKVNVHLVPSLVDAMELAESCAIVIDVLRATTSIVQALVSGAKCVYPCRTVDAALERAQRLDGPYLLAGERGGRMIDGFDLGNSPAEFVPEIVGGRKLVFTTTNGTAAIEHCHAATTIFLAAFSNLSAVVESVQAFRRVDIVCAGTDGGVTREDVLLAGAMVARLRQAATVECNDSSLLAAEVWNGVTDMNSNVLANTQGGRNLITLGMQCDLSFAARCDTNRIVPTRYPDGSFAPQKKSG